MPKDIKKLLLKADKLQMGKEMALAEEFIDINETIDEMSSKIETLSEEIKKKDYILEFDKEELRGEKGDNGMDGMDGCDYVLTESDKKEIAKSIKVPVVEKVIEKTEVIRETPIVTNEIKEVAKYESAESLRDKLETLTDDNRLDASAIKNLPEFINTDKRIGFGSMLKEAPKDNLIYGRKNREWVEVQSSSAWGSITGTLSNQIDLQNELNLKYDASNPAGYITSSALSGYTPTSRTITINGTTQDLSANRTWTIAVPTKTSDLTNDSGFITSSALSNYVAKTGNETIAGLKTFSSDIYGTKDANRAFRVGSLSGGDNNIWLGSSAINPTYANFIISTATNNAYTIFSSPAGSRMYFGINNVYLFNVSSTGAYFGSAITGATARLHISAGSATAGSAPLKLTTGTLNTTAEAGTIEYNNTFHVTNSDATRRHIVTAPNTTKVTASAPYTNDGYITINIGGTNFKVMTTA